MTRLNPSFKFLLILPLIIVGTSSCSKVLSSRTDDQAWLEFDQDNQLDRSPASVEKASAEIQKLREQVMKIPVRQILLRCDALPSAENCYSAQLELQFDETFRRVKKEYSGLKVTDYRKERKDFLSTRSFAKMVEDMNHFHQSVLSGMDLKAREHAETLFSSCSEDVRNTAAVESFNILSSVITEMPKGVYVCLSKKWQSDQDQLLEETSERLGLKLVSPEARNWIKKNQIAIVYESQIAELASRQAKEEKAEFEAKRDALFQDFNPKASPEANVREWSAKLREQFPYSPVEQWVLAYHQEQSKKSSK